MTAPEFGSDEFRARLTAFLSLFGEVDPLQVDWWMAALETVAGRPEDIEAACAMWLREHGTMPCPADILARVRRLGVCGKMTEISRAVADEWGVTLGELKGPSRVRDIAQARQHAYFLLREAGHSLPKIGRFFGRNHSTVTTGIQAHRRRAAAVEYGS